MQTSSLPTLDETTPLIINNSQSLESDAASTESDSSGDEAPKKPLTFEIMSMLSVLFTGVLVANVDMTFMVATYPQISSELHAFRDGSWLLISYMLAMCASQPLYGKLSNIFGRKRLLIAAYLLYALGSCICAVSRDIRQIIVGRVIGGAGGAGLVCLVSIIITDVVPLREVAVYRSYKLGWRVAFACIGSFTAAGALLVAWRLKLGGNGSSKRDQERVHESSWELLKMVDFLGSIFLSLSIVALLLIFSLGGEKLAWDDPRIFVLAAGTIAFGGLFYATETYWAAEPIFPPSLLTRRPVLTSYSLLALQNAAQGAASLSIPLFFQVLLSVGPSAAGSYLLPSVVGNTVGGLITGMYIKRYGRYKFPFFVAGLVSVCAYTMMCLRWGTEPGFMPVLEDMYIIGGGLGTGMVHAAAFVVLTAGPPATPVEEQGERHHDEQVQENIAITGSGIYLSGNIGGTIGFSLSSATLRWMVEHSLAQHLTGKELEYVRKKALESVGWVQGLRDGSRLKGIVVDAYVSGAHGTFVVATVCSALTIVVSLFIIEHKLR
ncbi:hypothetical protein CLAIMM_01149 [Cladophialophora immunda]|nr:hypothetical protein CLAIMM_01149 [Cladophialophora immunda]